MIELLCIQGLSKQVRNKEQAREIVKLYDKFKEKEQSQQIV